jgi:hypothetical protein
MVRRRVSSSSADDDLGKLDADKDQIVFVVSVEFSRFHDYEVMQQIYTRLRSLLYVGKAKDADACLWIGALMKFRAANTRANG